jgi:hypothetical protein
MTTMVGNASATLSVVSLRKRQKLTKAQRALIGVAIREGVVRAQDLPWTLIAEMVGVSISYLLAAQRLNPAQRQLVHNGFRPLLPPPVKHDPPPPVRMVG